MEELPTILTIIAEMLTDEDVEIHVGIQELAAMLPQRELFLKRNRGPTDFVGITEYVQYTVNRFGSPGWLFKYYYAVDGTDEYNEYDIEEEEEQKDEDLDHNERFSGKVYREIISSMLEY
ncbi:hypothetical protein DAPPUDRAFT_327668 [Daphnia pulex]|uniref:Uncharacterized protein n=1 Tax=Daphnia pulex TaxID=6669 RepID=E9HBD4_DAPPU|nr:hypothetical protein DAPPUDRAFT_327668 [Daphnia pulex]|eukprot:EFX70945.1 hypothetical protein DAPPUDRAFT_327668 [Daphnia pulex]